jgi:MOSC domain-containing protein YiiM
MKLIAVSVGGPREVMDERRGVVRTSIWKSPVTGPVRVSRLNLAGDAQSDLNVHGGPDMAVYVYPCEHYAPWSAELGRADLTPGGFGENLTSEGLLEDAVHIGDRLRIGTALFEVSQPRLPCFKLGIRFGDPRMVRRFQQSGRSGFYLRVLEEGELAAGAPIAREARGEGAVSVAEIVALTEAHDPDPAALARAAAVPGLSASWREDFAARAVAAGKAAS